MKNERGAGFPAPLSFLHRGDGSWESLAKYGMAEAALACFSGGSGFGDGVDDAGGTTIPSISSIVRTFSGSSAAAAS